MADTAPAAPFVRAYRPESDFDQVVHIFRETCHEPIRPEPVCTIASYLWCRPYVQLCAETCFVLDDGAGRAVGYIIGTHDTAAFVDAWTARLLPVVEPDLDRLWPGEDDYDDDRAVADRAVALLKTARDPRRACYGAIDERCLAPWPGHLHVDILPSHQRRGFGKRLLDVFLAAVRERGCRGVYLGMVATNDGAARFYARYGFRRLPHVLDDGRSGEDGRTPATPDDVGAIMLVLDL